VGTCADGGMLHTGYNKELNKLVTSNEAAHSFYSHAWDPSHLIELAEKDAKSSKYKSNKWVKEREDTITDVHKDVGYGKSLEEARDAAKELESKLQTPHGFSNTRWATYAHGVYKSFENNYSTLFQRLTKIDSEKADKINNAMFVAETTGLEDVYSEISKLSKNVQIPDMYPWQIEEAVTSSKNALEEMKQELSDPLDSSWNPPHLPNMGKAVKEILDSGTYKGMPILQKQHVPIGQLTRTKSNASENQEMQMSESIDLSRNRVKEYIQTFSDRLEHRFLQSNTNPEIVCQANEVFSMQKILSREPGEVPKSFASYCDSARNAGFIETSKDEMEKEYAAFTVKVHEDAKAEYYKANFPRLKWNEERKFYERLIFGKENQDNESFRNVNHLLAASTLRSSNESQVEAMGSVAKMHYRQRATIEPVKASQEIFLHWNGPPPTIKADGLIKEALTRRFADKQSQEWNFTRRTDREDKLKVHVISKVVDRVNHEDGRIKF